MNDIFLIKSVDMDDPLDDYRIEQVAEFISAQQHHNMRDFSSGLHRDRSKVDLHLHSSSGPLQQLYTIMRQVGNDHIGALTRGELPSAITEWYADTAKASGSLVIIGAADWLDDLGSQVAKEYFRTQPASHVNASQDYFFQLYSSDRTDRRMQSYRIPRRRGALRFTDGKLAWQSYRRDGRQ